MNYPHKWGSTRGGAVLTGVLAAILAVALLVLLPYPASPSGPAAPPPPEQRGTQGTPATAESAGPSATATDAVTDAVTDADKVERVLGPPSVMTSTRCGTAGDCVAYLYPSNKQENRTLIVFFNTEGRLLGARVVTVDEKGEPHIGDATSRLREHVNMMLQSKDL